MNKVCVDCKLVLPLNDFYDSKGNKGGKATCCKKCHYVRQRKSLSKPKNKDRLRLWKEKWFNANQEQLRAYGRQHRRERIAAMTPDELKEFRRKRQESKRIHRALKYGNGGRHSEAEWQQLLTQCEHKCLACGSTEKITRDHIIPLSKGGTDEINNIQPLCWSCNASKNRWRTTDYRNY